MRIRRFAATTALAGLATAGLIGLTSATPASATATDCIQYLQSLNEHGYGRDAVCRITETTAAVDGSFAARLACVDVMALTFLDSDYAHEACRRAVLA
jgi:hypothetical protein